MRRLALVSMITAPALMIGINAHADPFVSQLNCPIVGGNECTSATASYGQLTFTDVGGGTVDIAVSLASGLTIQRLDLNYDNSEFNAASTFTASVVGGGSLVVVNSPDNINVQGSGNFGGFDLEITDNSNGGGTLTGLGSSFTIELSASGLALEDLINFANQGLDAAVHLQNCGPNGNATCQPGQTGNNSLAVGELAVTPVPEPASLALLGSALLGFGVVRRRRKRV